MREFAERPARAPIEMRVDLKAGNETFAATTKNLGVGGVFIATERQLSVGDIVKSCGSRADQAAVFPAFFGSSILISSPSRSGCLPSTKRTPARTSGISA